MRFKVVSDFVKPLKVAVLPRRNARFSTSACKSRVKQWKNLMKPIPIGRSRQNILYDTPLITKNPRPSRGRVPSRFNGTQQVRVPTSFRMCSTYLPEPAADESQHSHPKGTPKNSSSGYSALMLRVRDACESQASKFSVNCGCQQCSIIRSACVRIAV